MNQRLRKPVRALAWCSHLGLSLALILGTTFSIQPSAFGEDENGFVIPPGKRSNNVFYGSKGDLIYRVQPTGDRIIDFAGAGYKGVGEQAVPSATDLAHLPSINLKTGQSIQNAINKMAKWPVQPDGFRGVIYLGSRHSTNLRLNASGIVLVGRAMNPKVKNGRTILTFKGNDQKAIRIEGSDGGPVKRGPGVRIASFRVPTGSRSFLVADPSQFSVGDSVEIKLAPNSTWVRDIGMHKEFWKPNDLAKKMRRVITSINGNEINIDEPTVITIWNRHGGATINTVEGGGSIRNIGIMGVEIQGIKIRGSSTLPGVAIHTGFAKDVFLRGIKTSGFKRSALYVSAGTENLTAWSVHYRGAGQTGGSHRYGFQIGGQKNFIYQARTFSARHAFVPNPGSTGGNVFRLAQSSKSIFEAGGHRHWSGATLWDQVWIKNDKLTARKVKMANINHGWRAVNNVAWNSRGRRGSKDVNFQNPKHAYNIKESQIMQIRSLYMAQREDRSGGIQFREYVIGDYDRGVKASSVDSPVVDPEWAGKFSRSVKLDAPVNGRTVAMTFDLNLQPGERVVGGQLSIGRTGTKGTMRINLNGIHQVVKSGQVVTIDMSGRLDAIQRGNLNVSVTSNIASNKIDFAMLKLKIGKGQPLPPIDEFSVTEEENGFRINWSEMDLAEGYRVYRGTTSSGLQATEIANLPSGTTTFLDSTDGAGQGNYYFIRYDAGELSPFSSGATSARIASTPNPKEAAPDGSMDRWWDGWMTGWDEGWTEGSADGWIDGLSGNLTPSSEPTVADLQNDNLYPEIDRGDGWSLGWRDGWLDGWNNGWVDGWADGMK